MAACGGTQHDNIGKMAGVPLSVRRGPVVNHRRITDQGKRAIGEPRCQGNQVAGSGRPGAFGHAEHGRVFLRFRHRKYAIWHDPQSVRSRATGWRRCRRIGCRGCNRHCAVFTCSRYEWTAACASGPLARVLDDLMLVLKIFRGGRIRFFSAVGHIALWATDGLVRPQHRTGTARSAR